MLKDNSQMGKDMGDITARYLEAARAKLSENSNKKITDYRLGKDLGISTTATHAYLKTDRECDDDDIILRIAQTAQVPALEIIAKIHEKKAQSPETKALWSTLLASASKNNSQHYILC